MGKDGSAPVEKIGPYACVWKIYHYIDHFTVQNT